MDVRPVIGLEAHIQLNTVTKLMCSCKNEYNPDYPNSNICPFCTGQPGALPLPNEEALRKAIRLGVALGSTIPPATHFDRKNYFYPDLPSGYQITQYEEPIVQGGSLPIVIENKSNGTLTQTSIQITRAHLETDAAKLIHAGGKTMVDFNRSGAPLIELVTEPVIHSIEEAMAFVSELQLLVRKLNISNADLEKGQMRFDINISLQNQDQQEKSELPPYRVEIKNVNSIRALGRAVAYEIERQKILLDSGTIPLQETRGWDDDKGVSNAQRSKEEAMDYRYFREPDLLDISIATEDIPLIEEIPELPSKQRERYQTYGLTLQTAQVLTSVSEMGELADAVFATATALAKELEVETRMQIANIISVSLPPIAEKKQVHISEVVSLKNILHAAELFANKQINNQGLAKALEIVSEDKDLDILEITATHNLLQVNDDSILEVFVDTVIRENPTQVEEYKQGKQAVLGYLIGQCMKESKGSGNPQKFKQLLEQKLVLT